MIASPPTADVPLLPLERSRGRAAIAFRRRGGATVLDGLFQQGCSKVRLPGARPPAPPEAVLINTAGGMTDGDRLDTEVRWRPGTSATITTQAAERIYRSRGGAATVDTHLIVEAGATACWLPQESILFDGGRLARRLTADLAPGSRLLAVESLVIGRPAMAERVRSGAVSDVWKVRVDGALVFADHWRLEDADSDLESLLARPGVAGGAGALATVVVVAEDAGDHLDVLRRRLAALGCTAGASDLGGLLVVRLLAVDGRRLRSALGELIVLLQSRTPGATGGSAGLPRVWNC